uniref:uncharacterized protein LOC124008884 n=1 Tax=Oncorhynchus gorbuscha TaxID=8017 RepID=UPI001EAF08AF|nr:uncharacterized protein LOC124008884 [Oncorhynchus gorbuscha]
MLIQQVGARKEQEQQRRLRRRGGAKEPADQVEARIRQMHCLLHPEKDEGETTLEKKPANNQYSLQWGQRVQGWRKITCLLLLMTYMLRQTSLTEALHSGTPKYHLQNGNNSSLKSMPIQMEAQSSQRRELQGKEQKGRPHKKEEKEESRRLKKRFSPQLTFQLLNGPHNVALRGVAAQSSLFNWENSPSKVIDGNRNTNYNYGGSCSSTAFNTNPWWRVDLLDVYRVTAVNITNRGDCCPERLDGAEIRIGNSLENNSINNPRCVVISNIPAGKTYTFQCNEMEGRYVVVVIPGQNKILTLCEVEVFATVKPPGDNVALRGVAAQSSQFSDRNAHYAIDGNSNTNYGSCTHTAQDTNPWWRVDLLDVYKVTAVTITNRDDVPERLDGAEIRIGNSLENNGINNPRCDVISHIPAGKTNTFQCNEIEGRYVVVVIYVRKEYLTLCELEVYGTPAVNVALKGVASQSSLNGYGNAHNAIDGNRESDYYKGSCTHTAKETKPWWRVDLLDVTRVTAVSITNRGDDVPERLDGAEIRIGNSLENNGINNPRCDVISHIPAGKTYTFQCNAMEGRYVVVVIPGRSEWLTLCEVEVFATVKTPESSTEAPKSKRTVVRMKIQSDADLTNQAVGDQLLQQASERERGRERGRES